MLTLIISSSGKRLYPIYFQSPHATQHRGHKSAPHFFVWLLYTVTEADFNSICASLATWSKVQKAASLRAWKDRTWGWRWTFVVEALPSLSKVVSSIPSPQNDALDIGSLVLTLDSLKVGAYIWYSILGDQNTHCSYNSSCPLRPVSLTLSAFQSLNNLSQKKYSLEHTCHFTMWFLDSNHCSLCSLWVKNGFYIFRWLKQNSKNM